MSGLGNLTTVTADVKADILTQVGTLVAAAGVLGEVACPSAQGEFFPLPILHLLLIR